MFRPAALRSSLQRLAVQARFKSTVPASSGGSPVPPNVLRAWYNTFGKSSAMYASWIMTLVVVGEFATGKLTDSLWTANNYGKTFTSADWSKFDPIEDEDEDEEEEDEGDDDE